MKNELQVAICAGRLRRDVSINLSRALRQPRHRCVRFLLFNGVFASFLVRGSFADEAIQQYQANQPRAEVSARQRQILRTIREQMENHGIQRNKETGREYYSSYGDLYDWELYFDSILLTYYGGEDYAINGLRLFLDKQQPNGFIPRRIPKYPLTADFMANDKWYKVEKVEHCKPFLCQIALIVSRSRNSTDWITPEDYQGLKNYLNHWFDDWDQDQNGLCEWNSGPHSGADTQLERVGSWGSKYCEGTDLNSFIYRECKAASYIAQALGHAEDAQMFDKRAERTAEAIRNTLWNEEDGLFYDRDARDGKTIKVKSAAIFLPIAVGIATPEQAETLVERYLNNPKEFATPCPVPSYSRSEPRYMQRFEPVPGVDPLYALGSNHGNWCGGMWPHWNIQITHGLQDYGFEKEARHLAEKHLEAISVEEGFYEWYDAETGKGRGVNPFWPGATLLGAMLPVELSTGFNPMKPEPVDQSLDFRAIRNVIGTAEEFAPSHVSD